MASPVEEGERDIEKGLITPTPSQNPLAEPSPTPSPSSATAPALVLSNSGKRIDQAGKKKYVKQVTGRHNDTELHLAAQKGDLAAVKQILNDIDSQMVGTLSGDDFNQEVAEIRASVVNEVNELGETAVFTAAAKGYLEVLKELLKYCNKETLTKKNRSGFDPLHIAASQGHHGIVQLLLEHDTGLSTTFGPSNATPLITAASRGHIAVVNELLSKDCSLLEISRSNGKNALHLAARQGHVEIVKALLDKDPQLARRTDKKGQTALHMAVKGISCEVVILLLEADAAIVMLPDKFGNTALHIATRKKRAEIVRELLRLPDSNVNALNRDHKTALDIAEDLPLSEESSEIKECLYKYGAVRANELNQPRDELRKTVSQIKKDIHTQLEQTKRTNKNVHGIAKELRKLHREGINNATNSVTVVAVLFATVAFAAIFTVPGGDDDHGVAVVVSTASFKIFFIFNALALFTSLAVVVVQITLVRGETKAERRVVEVINKLMWLASVCTSVAFMASSYIVVGRKYNWAAGLVTAVGGIIMVGVLGTMTYYVVRSRKKRSIRKKEKHARSGSNSWYHSEFSNSDIDRIYALSTRVPCRGFENGTRKHSGGGDGDGEFLYDTETTSTIDEIAKDIIEIANLQSKIRCFAVELEPHLSKLQGDSKVMPLVRALSEATSYASKDQVKHNKPLSLYVLRDHTRSIEKEFLVTYSVMGLSSSDLQQFLSGLQILEANTVQLLWAGKELTRGKKLCDFIGRNEKTKIVIKLQSPVPPPASLSGGEKS